MNRLGLGVLLAALCAALLCGCGGTASATSVATPEPVSSVPGPAPTPVAVETEDTASGADSAPHSNPTFDLPPYRLIPITQSTYQGEYGLLTFEELPATDAETLVCDDLYNWIMGEGETVGALWLPPDDGGFRPVMEGYEWLTVHTVRGLGEEEALTAGWSEDDRLFDSLHRLYGGGLDYDAYVGGVLAGGCQVVLVEYGLHYTDEYRALGPQLDDGERREHYLLVPDEEGNLKMFANDRFYSQFGPVNPDGVEFVPPQLDMRGESGRIGRESPQNP